MVGKHRGFTRLGRSRWWDFSFLIFTPSAGRLYGRESSAQPRARPRKKRSSKCCFSLAGGKLPLLFSRHGRRRACRGPHVYRVVDNIQCGGELVVWTEGVPQTSHTTRPLGSAPLCRRV